MGAVGCWMEKTIDGNRILIPATCHHSPAIPSKPARPVNARLSCFRLSSSSSLLLASLLTFFIHIILMTSHLSIPFIILFSTCLLISTFSNIISCFSTVTHSPNAQLWHFSINTGINIYRDLFLSMRIEGEIAAAKARRGEARPRAPRPRGDAVHGLIYG
jgi:hypothetical protein